MPIPYPHTQPSRLPEPSPPRPISTLKPRPTTTHRTCPQRQSPIPTSHHLIPIGSSPTQPLSPEPPYPIFPSPTRPGPSHPSGPPPTNLPFPNPPPGTLLSPQDRHLPNPRLSSLVCPSPNLDAYPIAPTPRPPDPLGLSSLPSRTPYLPSTPWISQALLPPDLDPPHILTPKPTSLPSSLALRNQPIPHAPLRNPLAPLSHPTDSSARSSTFHPSTHPPTHPPLYATTLPSPHAPNPFQTPPNSQPQFLTIRLPTLDPPILAARPSPQTPPFSPPTLSQTPLLPA